MEEKTITLVVNADDFGLSEAINRGIVNSCRQGIVRSSSLMPNGSALDDAIKLAKETPELGVGIHISLVGEKPVADPDDLDGLVSDDGLLPASFGEFIKQYMLRKFSPKEVRLEIQAQVNRVLSAGISPTHIDSHQHLHVFPGVLEIVLDIAKSAGIPVIRFPFEKDNIGTRLIPHLMLSACCLRALPKIDRSKLRHSDHFRGFGVSGSMTEDNLTQILHRLPPGVNEIMCHPGYADPATTSKYDWGYNWNAELDGLCSERVKEIIDERGIHIANFHDAWG